MDAWCAESGVHAYLQCLILYTYLSALLAAGCDCQALGFEAVAQPVARIAFSLNTAVGGSESALTGSVGFLC